MESNPNTDELSKYTKLIDEIINIKTFSEQNLNEHWAIKAKRHKNQQKFVRATLLLHRSQLQYIDQKSGIKIVIKLTRIAPRELDKWENLPYSFKWILDEVCSFINPGLAKGRADNDPRISVQYDQRKGKVGQYAIQLQIFII